LGTNTHYWNNPYRLLNLMFYSTVEMCGWTELNPAVAIVTETCTLAVMLDLGSLCK